MYKYKIEKNFNYSNFNFRYLVNINYFVIFNF